VTEGDALLCGDSDEEDETLGDADGDSIKDELGDELTPLDDDTVLFAD
jgi:hypothetical protein